MAKYINKAQAKEDLDKFYAQGQHNDPSNFLYRDYVFAASIKEKYGMSVSELTTYLDYEVETR